MMFSPLGIRCFIYTLIILQIIPNDFLSTKCARRPEARASLKLMWVQNLQLTDSCLRRCASLISKPDIQDFEGLRASAMWVRRALQRAEPRALIGFKGRCVGGAVMCWFLAQSQTLLFFAPNARRARCGDAND